MTSLTMTFWTDQRVEELKSHVAAKLSGGQIAVEMGVTRNMIISKARRLGLSLFRLSKHSNFIAPNLTRSAKLANAQRAATVRLRAREQKKTSRRIAATPESGTRPRPGRILPVVFRPRPDPAIPLHVQLIHLQQDMCRWPYGEGPFTFCGCQQQEGSWYCAAHFEMSKS